MTRPERPPQACGQCGHAEADWHCPNEQCCWARCRQCKGITNVKSLMEGQGA